MGDALVRLAQKLDQNHVSLTRIFIPAYPRIRNGQREDVDAHWREIESIADLDRDELAAWRRGGRLRQGRPGEVVGPPREVRNIPPPPGSREAREAASRADLRYRGQTLQGGGFVPRTERERERMAATEDLTPSGHRPLSQIAAEVRRDWSTQKSGINFAAAPYLDALDALNDIKDMYGADSADMIVAYFLGNASQWRGPKAKEIKAELKAILKKNR
jgi:hypothetical protein